MSLQNRLMVLAIVVFFMAAPAAAQTPKSKQASKQGVTRQRFLLGVSTRDVWSVSLNAEGVPLAEIAADLSKRLKIPVKLSKIAEKIQVSTNFNGLLLEPAMQMLSPEVYIDYEVNAAPGAQPRPLGIYFNTYNEPQPAINSVVPNTAQVIMIEGHTETNQIVIGAPGENGDPVSVSYEQQLLSVKARRQPLTLVLSRIADELGIPLEFKTESDELVDVDIIRSSVEDAVKRLSPNIRLYVRADLQRLYRRAFRMVLVAPDAPPQPGL